MCTDEASSKCIMSLSCVLPLQYTCPSEDSIRVLRGHQLSVTCVAMTPDDRYIYSGSKDCCIIKCKGNIFLQKTAICVHFSDFFQICVRLYMPDQGMSRLGRKRSCSPATERGLRAWSVTEVM